MNRILLIGDPHFKVSNKLETDQFTKSTLEYLEENSSDLGFIVVLGDILDTHEKIHTQPFCRAVQFLTSLSKLIKTYVLIGNHDRINNNVFMTPEHPFTGMDQNDNLIIVDSTIQENDFVFVPYVPNGRFKEALSHIDYDFSKAIAIFAHQEFKGCKMGAIISEDGDIWEENLPPIFSGHIHDFQQPQKNILYTGTPFQHSFSDKNDKANVKLFVDRDSWKIEKICTKVTPKRLFSMKLSEFEGFVPPENCLIKINFLCQNEDFKKIISSRFFRDKIKKFNIQYKLKVEKSDKIEMISSNFVENLYSEIDKTGGEIKNLFYEIF